MYGEGEMSSDSADVGCHGCMVLIHISDDVCAFRKKPCSYLPLGLKFLLNETNRMKHVSKGTFDICQLPLLSIVLSPLHRPQPTTITYH